MDAETARSVFKINFEMKKYMDELNDLNKS
jgi:hypothetical protein